jgi:hypothetical protein
MPIVHYLRSPRESWPSFITQTKHFIITIIYQFIASHEIIIPQVEENPSIDPALTSSEIQLSQSRPSIIIKKVAIIKATTKEEKAPKTEVESSVPSKNPKRVYPTQSHQQTRVVDTIVKM